MWNPDSTEKELEIQVQIARNPETKTCNQESKAKNPESMTVLDYFTLDEPQQDQNSILTLSYWTNFWLNFGLYLRIQYLNTFGTKVLKIIFKFLVFKVIPNALKSLYPLG